MESWCLYVDFLDNNNNSTNFYVLRGPLALNFEHLLYIFCWMSTNAYFDMSLHANLSSRNNKLSDF